MEVVDETTVDETGVDELGCYQFINSSSYRWEYENGSACLGSFNKNIWKALLSLLLPCHKKKKTIKFHACERNLSLNK